MTDISRTGCYLETGYPLPVGTVVQLRLTIAGIVMEVGARVAWITPQVGMGMYFAAMSAEEENRLSQIIEEVTGVRRAVDRQPVEPAEQGSPQSSQSGNAIRIKRESAPEILTKIIKRINEKGVLTRQELIEIVKAHQP